jgi:hypothetical protein
MPSRCASAPRVSDARFAHLGLCFVLVSQDFIWPKIDELTRINDERQQLAKASQKPQSETSQRFQVRRTTWILSNTIRLCSLPSSRTKQMCFHVRDPELYFLEDPKRLDTPRVLVRTDVIYRYLTDSHVDNLTYATSVMLERLEIRKSALDVRLLSPIDRWSCVSLKFTSFSCNRTVGRLFSHRSISPSTTREWDRSSRSTHTSIPST